MEHFPVTSSTLSAKDLGEYLQRMYAFGSQVKSRIIRGGLNDTYLVEDGSNRYVFRVYSFGWRSEAEILEEIRVLQLLKEKNISVSSPIADAGNNYIHTFHAPEGKRFGVLFTYAEGEKLMNYSEELHYKAGVLMAQFHAATNGLRIQRATYTADILLKKSFEEISKFLSSGSDEWKYMELLWQQLLDEFQKVKTNELRHGVVHLDFWFDNFNIDKNQIITLFDFDFCGNGWLCLDIAYYMMQLHNLERYDLVVVKRKLDQFFRGYESVTPLTDEEKRILPLLGMALYFFYYGTQCRRFENWSNEFLSETYLKRHINGIVKRYYEIHKLGEL